MSHDDKTIGRCGVADNSLLLPCPFCGGKAAVHGASYMTKKFPACTACGAERGTVAQWNTRAVTDMHIAEATRTLDADIEEQRLANHPIMDAAREATREYFAPLKTKTFWRVAIGLWALVVFIHIAERVFA